MVKILSSKNKDTEQQELMNGYNKILINANTSSSAYEAIKLFKGLAQSMRRDFQEELKKCVETKGKGLIADVLSNAIYKASNGDNEARELAIKVISTGIVVDLQSTFSNILAPNEQATLKIYATLKGEYGIVEAIEQIEHPEHNLHHLKVEISGEAFDIV